MPVSLDVDATALLAADLVIRAIVVYCFVCCHSNMTRERMGLRSFAENCRRHTCRDQDWMSRDTFTRHMLSSRTQADGRDM